MSGKIFINYRRGDDPGYTQALYQRLEDEFTNADLFMDVEGHIRPGDDFVEVLNAQVAAADVLLVIIGPRWTELLAARAGDPDDFVVIEIGAALQKDKRVIPVLVGGAAMPRADTLPESIRQLARRNAVGIRPERFKADCQGLVTALKEQLAAAEKQKAAQTFSERAAAEAERRKREADEAARIAAAEERAHAQSLAGLSPEEVRKAEELANWDFIKERGQAQDLRDHMARFPDGVTALYALTRLEELVWAGLGQSPDISAVQNFLEEFPKGAHSGDARAKLAELERAQAEAIEIEERKRRETEAWAAASSADTLAAYQSLLKDWPGSDHANAGKIRLKELKTGPGRRRLLLGIAVAGAAMGVAGLFAAFTMADIVDALRPLPAFAEPEMAIIPAGEFTMGGGGSTYDWDDEKPPHRVKIAQPFAAGKYELTFDEWDICVKDGGCKNKPSSNGWGRGRRPVINVSWDDAKQYVAWLSKKTGKPYRLLSEAEWEYAARAGSKTEYSWGVDFGKGNANCQRCGSQWDDKQTAPVGSFKANAFGLFDMHGNVWEWVEDCYHDNYRGAPSNGSAWTAGDCGLRVFRGGSWNDDPQHLRAAYRFRFTTGYRYGILGFRVGRTLTP